MVSYKMAVPTCNPNYLRGRDWEDHSLMSAQAKSLQDPPYFNK
jgi:hypothetical protein